DQGPPEQEQGVSETKRIQTIIDYLKERGPSLQKHDSQLPKMIQTMIDYFEEHNPSLREQDSSVINEIQVLIDHLKKHKDLLHQQDSQVTQLAYHYIDQVRFLIKPTAYKHEKEVRLIQFRVSDTHTKLDDRVPPRLYIEVPHEFAPDTIILGPRADRLEDWRALEKTSRLEKVQLDSTQLVQVIKVKKSKLKVRP
ncbi:MAG: hypothetical protein ACR2PW_06795, partial [Gammaproteobacteria bacterium]